MLRIHCLQQWYALSDPTMEETLYVVESMSRFESHDCKSVGQCDVASDSYTDARMHCSGTKLTVLIRSRRIALISSDI